jgi:hypothetical protein
MAAAYPFPPWMQKFLVSKYNWRVRFAWIPCRNTETGEIMWLKRYHYGVRLIEGPAGESPVKLVLRLTPAQHTWHQLTNQQ